MRLTDLEPKWLVRDGRRVGFIFRCPTDRRWYQACMFEQTPRREQWRLFNSVLGEGKDPELCDHCVQGARPDFAWVHAGGTEFADLSVTPSIDGSAGGMWHGYITNGEIVRGI